MHFTELRETLIVSWAIHKLRFKEVNLRLQIIADHLIIEHEENEDSLVQVRAVESYLQKQQYFKFFQERIRKIKIAEIFLFYCNFLQIYFFQWNDLCKDALSSPFACCIPQLRSTTDISDSWYSRILSKNAWNYYLSSSRNLEFPGSDSNTAVAAAELSTVLVRHLHYPRSSWVWCPSAANESNFSLPTHSLSKSLLILNNNTHLCVETNGVEENVEEWIDVWNLS